MKFEKREDKKIKYKALYWLRIEQRCAFIATEVGNFAADVLGVSEKKMIEIEVKITKADLLNDRKKDKHRVYNGIFGIEWSKQWKPTHFYYAVPSELVETCQKYLADNQFTMYGIINADDFTVVKRAAWIHKNEPSSHVKFKVALRMGSELLRFHEAWL